MQILTFKVPTESEIKINDITNLLFRNYEAKIRNAFEINAAYISELLKSKDINVEEYAELISANNKMSLLF